MEILHLFKINSSNYDSKPRNRTSTIQDIDPASSSKTTMHFSTYLTSALLATITTSLPTTNQNQNQNLTAITPLPPTLLLKTSPTTEQPYYCSFPSREFWYLPFQYNNRNACIGMETFTQSPGPWSQAEYANIISAMNEQVTKDGLFKSSQVGCWVANFEKFTSAIPDREGYKEAFRWGLETGEGMRDASFKTFFFQLDGQYIAVRRLLFC